MACALLKFQCSSASRKFLNQIRDARFVHLRAVSVLFSEPKIPQSPPIPSAMSASDGFSALQRAENSSMRCTSACCRRFLNVSVLFSEPKIPQCIKRSRPHLSNDVSVLFSEPKIPQSASGVSSVDYALGFQCSSASRKFLNPIYESCWRGTKESFSALQRAENSSM